MTTNKNSQVCCKSLPIISQYSKKIHFETSRNRQSKNNCLSHKNLSAMKILKFLLIYFSILNCL